MGRKSKVESDFQGKLIKELEQRFPGCIVLKNDPNYLQGIPDLMVLYKDHWAALECKRDEEERKHPRPNQEHYVGLMNKMSFASFIYPEIKEDVISELEHAFRA